MTERGEKFVLDAAHPFGFLPGSALPLQQHEALLRVEFFRGDIPGRPVEALGLSIHVEKDLARGAHPTYAVVRRNCPEFDIVRRAFIHAFFQSGASAFAVVGMQQGVEHLEVYGLDVRTEPEMGLAAGVPE